MNRHREFHPFANMTEREPEFVVNLSYRDEDWGEFPQAERLESMFNLLGHRIQCGMLLPDMEPEPCVVGEVAVLFE